MNLSDCLTCRGSGYGGDGGHQYNDEAEYAGMAEHVCRVCPVPCPDCDGLGVLIPDEWVAEVRHHLRTFPNRAQYSYDYTATDHARRIVAAVLRLIEGSSE